MKLKLILPNILYTLIFILVLVWPMPHVIAIRNVAIVLIFLISIIIYFNYKKNYLHLEKKEKFLTFSIILFVAWSIIASIFSDYRNYCFSELKQFVQLILLGFSTFFMINSIVDYKKIFILVFFGLFIFPAYHFLYSINYYLLHHILPFRSYGITVGLDEINFLMPYLLTFFAVEIIFRITRKKSLIPISNFLLTFLLLITIFSLFVQAKRNGIISIIFMIISIIFFINLISRKISKKGILIGIVGILIASSLFFLNLKKDIRWNNFIKSFKIVFIQNNMDRLYGKIPKNLDSSNYERMFYIKEGVKLIIDNPLGYGYGREIFGKALSKKYNVHIHTHAHSGIIDWGVAIGIPGLILWSIIIFMLVIIGLKSFLNYYSYFGLFIVYLSLSFYFRMFLDSINKDHMLQQFVFFTSLAFFAMQREINEKNNIPTS